MKIVHVAQYLNPGMGYQEMCCPIISNNWGTKLSWLLRPCPAASISPTGLSDRETTEHGFRVIRLPVWGLN